jgi:hypothetical protein
MTHTFIYRPDSWGVMNGFYAPDAPDNFDAVDTGIVLAHDILEHPRRREDQGEVHWELHAMGASLVTRIAHGYVSRKYQGYYDPYSATAGTIDTLLTEYSDLCFVHCEPGVYKMPSWRYQQAVHDVVGLMDRNLERYDYHIPADISEVRSWIREWMMAGASWAEKKWKGTPDCYLFQLIEDVGNRFFNEGHEGFEGDELHVSVVKSRLQVSIKMWRPSGYDATRRCICHVTSD